MYEDDYQSPGSINSAQILQFQNKMKMKIKPLEHRTCSLCYRPLIDYTVTNNEHNGVHVWVWKAEDWTPLMVVILLVAKVSMQLNNLHCFSGQKQDSEKSESVILGYFL